jgi:hypothetical protein
MRVVLTQRFEKHRLTPLVVFKLHVIPFFTPTQRMEADGTASDAALDDGTRVPSTLITDMAR